MLHRRSGKLAALRKGGGIRLRNRDDGPALLRPGAAVGAGDWDGNDVRGGGVGMPVLPQNVHCSSIHPGQ